MTTTDRIPAGFPRLDALLGGGLRAGTLTVIARGDTQDERDATRAMIGALTNHAPRGGPDFFVYPAGSPLDPAQIKSHARESGTFAVMVRSLAAGEALEPDADVLLRVTGKAYQLRVDVAKHRGGDTGSLVFTCVGGALAENGVCRWDEPRPADPGVTAEGARWAEAMAGVVSDLVRHAASCQTLLDVRGANPRIDGKRAAYEHAAELLRAAIVDARRGH